MIDAAVMRTVMVKNKPKDELAEDSAVIPENPIEPAQSAAQAAGVEQDCNQDGVAALAYQMWQERGCPIGSDQEDWFRAENELKNRRVAAGAS